ncbi:MAG: GTPase [Candidatus Hodarchaeales archaeon]
MTSTNPFRSIIPIPRAEKLYTMAYNVTMKTSVRGMSESVPPIRRMRKKESARVEIMSKELRSRLFRIVQEFPTLDAENIAGFYVEILNISFDVDEIRKTLGSFSGAADVIWKIKREYLGNVWHASSILAAKEIRRSAFARMRSVIMKLDKRLQFIEEVRQKMRLMPGIDVNLPTFCIAGYPNVGKSSLVNAITTAKPEIGAYPFTTKEVTLGHLQIPIYSSSSAIKPITHVSVQVVDTPGILDRPLEEKNQIELKALAAIKTLATAIVFIFDFTQFDVIDSQLNLFNGTIEVFDKTPCLIICSKADLLSKAQQEEAISYLKENLKGKEFHFLSMKDNVKAKNLLTTFFHENKEIIAKSIEKERARYRLEEE